MISIIVTAVTAALSPILKAVLGDKSARDAAKNELKVEEAKTPNKELDVSVGAQNAAAGDTKQTTGFISGLNRILRPVFTIAIIGVVAWFFIDPVSFTVWASKFAILPDWLWAMVGGVFAFWLGVPLTKFVKPSKVLTQKEAEVLVGIPPPVVTVPNNVPSSNTTVPVVTQPSKPSVIVPTPTKPAPKPIPKPTKPTVPPKPTTPPRQKGEVPPKKKSNIKGRF